MNKEELPTSHEVIFQTMVEKIEEYCKTNNTEIRLMGLTIENYEANIQLRFKGYKKDE